MGWIYVIGLLLGLLGPGLVILPTFPRVERLIIDQNQIDRLQEGRQELHRERIIDQEHQAYSEIYQIIDRNWSGDLVEQCCGFRIPQVGFTLEEGNTVYSQGTIVYSVDNQGVENKNPITENKSQEIESVFVVDDWISDRIKRLRELRIQRIRGFGFFLVVLSVFSQAGSTFL